MIAAVVAAALLMSPSNPSPSGSSAAAQTSPQAASMRRIVYTFSFDQTEERTVEAFGAPPQSSSTRAGFSGTLTIDVLHILSDSSVFVDATEMTDAQNQTKAKSAKVVVHPDGGLTVTEGMYDTDMLVLLPYLATGYFGDHPLQEGNAWQTSATRDSVVTNSSYRVEKVDGDLATVSCTETEKGGSIHGTVLTRTRVVYKASLLIPISLNIQASNDRMGQGATQGTRTIYNFQRTSDSRDASAGRQ